ncbi:hypothetical protein F751_0145 [Auxenochlorella protothecoides]|uniref:Uncharacterized protein n=1 Tax=Auxenochlorella protothecoides TaxID=3075 RepID=A0A087S9J4_AUXPR|nr:hypothetical protein F751_0145 [Auxenochlorella protothecoides]KFM22398.1 hypothetical protein F751_0145 [Auxenochlorella protothecoides]
MGVTRSPKSRRPLCSDLVPESAPPGGFSPGSSIPSLAILKDAECTCESFGGHMNHAALPGHPTLPRVSCSLSCTVAEGDLQAALELALSAERGISHALMSAERNASECEAALLRVQTVLQAVHERAMAALDWRDPRPHLVRLISVVTSPSHFVRDLLERVGTDAGLSPQDLLSLFHECAVNGAPGLLSAARLGQALQLYLAVMNCWSQVDSADGGEDAQLATWVKAVDARLILELERVLQSSVATVVLSGLRQPQVAKLLASSCAGLG